MVVSLAECNCPSLSVITEFVISLKGIFVAFVEVSTYALQTRDIARLITFKSNEPRIRLHRASVWQLDSISFEKNLYYYNFLDFLYIRLSLMNYYLLTFYQIHLKLQNLKTIVYSICIQYLDLFY